MPDKIVEVIGKGRVAFPDTMSDAEILAVLKRQNTPDKPGIIESFVNRGIETAKGIGGLALDAGKSALTPEGQVTFLPRLAKGMYEGAVDAGAGAIARQFPRGMDDQPGGADFYKSAARAGAAAVPVVGPYVMNKVSDIEQGDWRKVAGETGFDAVAAAATGGAPKAVPPALAKMRAMGGNLALDARDIARSRIWGPALGGAIGTAVGGPVGGAIGFGADLVYSTRYARNAKKVKAAAAAERAAIADSMKSATNEVKLLESAEKELARTAKAAQTDTVAAAKIESRTLDMVDKGRAQSVKAAETDSMASGGIEARILEASQKTQAAVQQEVAVAQHQLELSTIKNRAKAEADLQVAQVKAAAAAKRVEEASQRAEAAQFKREWKQRTQLDKQAAKSSPAPAQAAAPAVSGQVQPPVTPAAPAPPAISAPAVKIDPIRRAINQMVNSDLAGKAEAPSAAAMVAQAQKSFPNADPAVLKQLVSEAKRGAVVSEQVANGLLQGGESIRATAITLRERFGIPANKSVEMAYRIATAKKSTNGLNPAQMAEYKAGFSKVSNIRKHPLVDELRSMFPDEN